MAECYFSPNLAVKSLEIAKKADLQPLTKRAAALVIAQRQYREQQRLIKEQREVMACSFTPSRKSPPRSSRFGSLICPLLQFPKYRQFSYIFPFVLIIFIIVIFTIL